MPGRTSPTRWHRFAKSSTALKPKHSFSPKRKLCRYREGVRQAQRETYLPCYKKHSALEALLAKAYSQKWTPKYEPYGQKPQHNVVLRGNAKFHSSFFWSTSACKECGFRWPTKKAKSEALKKKRHQCWAKREKLYAPLCTGQQPSDASGMLLPMSACAFPLHSQFFTTQTLGIQDHSLREKFRRNRGDRDNGVQPDERSETAGKQILAAMHFELCLH